MKVTNIQIDMNAQELTLAYHRTQEQRYDFMIPNSVSQLGYEMDIMCVRKSSRYIEEIEIKTSRSDFLADFRKTIGRNREKHKELQRGNLLANYFCFLVPHNLLDKVKDDIPKEYGIYTGYQVLHFGKPSGMIRQIRKPKALHNGKPSQELLFKKARGATFRYWSLLHERELARQEKSA